MKHGLLKALGLAGMIAVVGCGDSIKGNYEGYNAELDSGIGFQRGNVDETLIIYSRMKNGGYIKFDDLNDDGRYDEINLVNISKGDPVEKYASLEAGQKIANELRGQGERK